MKTVAIIGAGTMGHAFAHILVQGGYRVFLNDLAEEILQRARRLIASNLKTLFRITLPVLPGTPILPTLPAI